MSRASKMLLVALLLGGSSAAAGVVLTILVNWFFRGQAGISSDQFERMLIVGFVFGLMPLGLFWARPRK
jgi:hypothetical protein